MGASEDRERLAYLHYHGRVDTQHIALDADRDFSWIGAGFIAGGADSSADLQGSGQRITDALDPVALGRLTPNCRWCRASDTIGARQAIDSYKYLYFTSWLARCIHPGRSTYRNGYQIYGTYYPW